MKTSWFIILLILNINIVFGQENVDFSDSGFLKRNDLFIALTSFEYEPNHNNNFIIAISDSDVYVIESQDRGLGISLDMGDTNISRYFNQNIFKRYKVSDPGIEDTLFKIRQEYVNLYFNGTFRGVTLINNVNYSYGDNMLFNFGQTYLQICIIGLITNIKTFNELMPIIDKINSVYWYFTLSKYK